MSTTFTLIVTKSPFDSRNAESAIAFCYAAIKGGHKIDQVFFYQSGVQNASSELRAGNDEFNIRNKWLELHETNNINLNVCTTAGARRGIHEGNTYLPFQSVGLSAYFQALADNSINIQL